MLMMKNLLTSKTNDTERRIEHKKIRRHAISRKMATGINIFLVIENKFVNS
jgi:hypothetical protein